MSEDTPGLGMRETRNKEWASDTSRFGYRMLLKMGWKDGKGLGAEENGRTDAIKAVKRPENVGIGATDSSKNWIKHTAEFERILAALNAKHKEKTSGKRRRVRTPSETILRKAKKDKKGHRDKKRKHKPVLFHSHARTRRAKDASKYGTAAMKEIMGESEA